MKKYIKADTRVVTIDDVLAILDKHQVQAKAKLVDAVNKGDELGRVGYQYTVLELFNLENDIKGL